MENRAHGKCIVTKNNVYDMVDRDREIDEVRQQHKTMTSKLLSHLNNHPRVKLAIQLSFSTILIPAIPILYWSHNAKKEREEREREVATKLR